MDASEALLRAIAWRLALLVIAVFVARTVPDGRAAELQASDSREVSSGSTLSQHLTGPELPQADP
jgi:hypothetical protein